MSDSSATVPRLRVESVTLTTEVERWSVLELLARTSATQPLTWLRNGEGMVGAGRVLRLAFRGEHRFRDAARAWQTLVSAAEIVDEVNLPGSGLVAFGTFAFSPLSASDSVLLIPEIVFGQRDGVMWVTRFSDVTAFPDEVALEGELDVTFVPGALNERGYEDAVEAALRHIDAGQVDKVVLARDLVATLPDQADLRLAVSHLAHLYDDCWTFAVDGMIGATPETLIQVTDGAVSGRILAGTAPRNEHEAFDQAEREALLASDKDRAEHDFAVANVMRHLGPFTQTLSHSPQPFALELPNVWHLATDFTAQLNDGATVIDAVAALHPTAAVAGSPTAAAVALIDELEPFDRGRYAGPVGWVDANGNGEWGIALRCAWVRNGEVTAYAGGGIVAGSTAEAELAETNAKFEPIVRAFSGDS